jgi:hypothetical protein
MNDLTVNGLDYKFDKIPALAQFHIVRRLAPIIGELLGAVGPSLKGGKTEVNQDEMLKALVPITTALAKLSDEDADYIIFGLLKVVTRKQSGGGWAKIVTGSVLMFDDIDMKVMVQLAVKSFMVNLGGFITALPSVSKEQAVTAQ